MEQQKEITLVKKGLFYYIFKLIAFPFRLIFYLFRLILKPMKIYLMDLKEYQAYAKKKKHLNKMLSKGKLQGEII